MCIVEAVLRQGDSHDVYQRMGGIFQENYGCIDENAESPQASLKEKSKKVCFICSPLYLMRFESCLFLFLCISSVSVRSDRMRLSLISRSGVMMHLFVESPSTACDDM